MVSRLRVRLVVVVLTALVVAAPAAWALEPDQLVLVVNRNEPMGTELANFYAKERGVPVGRILPLDLPTGDEIPFADYEANVVPAVRTWLTERGLSDQVKCLVTFYGVPLRIAAKLETPADMAERREMMAALTKAQAEVIGPASKLEAMAKGIDPGFSPAGGGTFAATVQQANEAAKLIQDHASSQPTQERERTLAEMYRVLEPLLGDELKLREMILQQDRGAGAGEPTTLPAGDLQLPSADEISTFRANYQRSVLAAERLEQRRYDPQSRAQLRALVSSRFGLLNYTKLLETQLDYLNPLDTASAFDSELSLVRWISYSHVRWRENPFYYGIGAGRARLFAPTYMVMRLDAPKPQIVKSMISASIDAEQHGLSGQVVLDSRGMNPATVAPAQRVLAQWDQHIRDLATLLREHTKLHLLADDKPDVLPPNSAKDVALYCGWYSLRNYVPECEFATGAVGYHIASYELLTLHQHGERGWVAGLLNHGVVGTLGPVSEPYVEAFPRPDDFFPLLLTGKLSLAEVYWDTTPMTSWMISCIGDPLYTPYRKDPALETSDLPVRLQSVFEAAAGEGE